MEVNTIFLAADNFDKDFVKVLHYVLVLELLTSPEMYVIVK